MGWGDVAASVIPGVGAYLGGREAANATREANKANLAFAREQLKLQEHYGRNGIAIKALDARRAGLSPLAAMGAQTFNPSPVSAGQVPADGMAGALSDMGQSLGRAASAVATQEERALATQQLHAMNALQIENQGLQNEMLKKQIQQISNPGNPAMPGLKSNSGIPLLTGQADSRPNAQSYVTEKPLERIHSSPGNPAQEVGTVPDYGFARTTTGLAVVPSQDVKQKIEDTFLPELAWSVRNQLMPNLGTGPKPPDPKYYPPPKGSTHWVWNPVYQEFQGNNDVPNWVKNLKKGLGVIANPDSWKGK